jgi:hypothetical protein
VLPGQDGGSVATWLGGIGAMLQAVIVAIAAVFAWSQLREVRSDRWERQRPFVIVEVEPTPEHGPPHLDVVVSNIGQTIAREVTIDVDPPFITSWEGKAPSLQDCGLFGRSIPSIAPGRTHRLYFDSMGDRTDQDLPDSYTVTVSYGEVGGRRPPPDVQHIELGMLRNFTYINTKSVHDVAEELMKLRTDLGKWTPASGRRGLHVRSDADLAAEAERMRARKEEMARQAQASRVRRDEELANAAQTDAAESTRTGEDREPPEDRKTAAVPGEDG